MPSPNHLEQVASPDLSIYVEEPPAPDRQTDQRVRPVIKPSRYLLAVGGGVAMPAQRVRGFVRAARKYRNFHFSVYAERLIAVR
jgi:hypothetical protein